MAELNDETIERGNGDGSEIDLRSEVDVRDEVDLQQRLRFAAGSLAADFTGTLSLDVAEELIFTSAEGLLAAASVTDFVPILAERRARRAVRSSGWAPPLRVAGGAPSAAPLAAVPPPPTSQPSTAAAPEPAPPVPERAAPPEPPTPSAPAAPAAEPLFAVPTDAVAQLRHGMERLRGLVDEWRADLTQR